MIQKSWPGRDVINILDFTRDDLETLFETAEQMKKMLTEGRVPRLLGGRIIALAFFEPSTRTRLSFETAAKRLGAETIGFVGEEATSLAKGENLADTIRMLD
ncbi:MAG TPA: aspartate carbamoyltransferase, partial [Pyrodictium sp.]|nr:aspartate carbamoyltransferase [Pyrodictium sp.]